MIRRYTGEEARALRSRCFADEVFVRLHPALRWAQQQGLTELTPMEVFAAASEFAARLCKLSEPEEELPYEVDELRDFCDDEDYSESFLLLFSTAFVLTPLSVTDERVKTIVALLLGYIHDSDLYGPMRKLVLETEKQRTQKGITLDLLTYELQSLTSAPEGKDLGDALALMDRLVVVAESQPAEWITHTFNVVSQLNLQYDHAFDRHLHCLNEINARKTATRPTTVQGDYIETKVDNTNTGSNVFLAPVTGAQFGDNLTPLPCLH